jgi:hypothetical protein
MYLCIYVYICMLTYEECYVCYDEAVLAVEEVSVCVCVCMYMCACVCACVYVSVCV